jgi:hypothetical protein
MYDEPVAHDYAFENDIQSASITPRNRDAVKQFGASKHLTFDTALLCLPHRKQCKDTISKSIYNHGGRTINELGKSDRRKLYVKLHTSNEYARSSTIRSIAEKTSCIIKMFYPNYLDTITMFRHTYVNMYSKTNDYLASSEAPEHCIRIHRADYHNATFCFDVR